MVDNADSDDWHQGKSRACDAAAKLKLTRELLEISQNDLAILRAIPVSTLQIGE